MRVRRLRAPIGASLVVLSSLFYASYGIWTRLMGDSFNGFTASALRSALVLLLLLPIAAVLHGFEPLNLKKNWPYIAGIFASSLVTWGPLYYAILHAGVGLSIAIAYAAIVLGMFLFGWLLAGEHFSRDKALSATLGMIGLACIFAPSIAGFGWLALTAALVSGLSTALASVLAKRIPYNATQSTIMLWVCSAAANFIMAVPFGEKYPTLELNVVWLYLVIFAIASVVASWSLIKGMKLVDAGAAGVLGLLEIVFGLAFGVIFFGERPGAVELAGACIIILAAAVPYMKDLNLKRGTLA